MQTLVQLAVAGVAVGMIYALVALGFVLIYRAANVVNFSQGEFAMVPAFILTFLLTSSGLPLGVAVVGTLAFAVAFGAVFNRLIYYPLRKRSLVPVVIATIGVSVFLKNTVQVVFGAQPRRVEPVIASNLEVGGITINSQYIVIIAVTSVLLVLQYLLFERTLLGKKLQATAQNADMAALLGINTEFMVMLTFVYSALLGAAAGILVAPLFGVTIAMGTLIALKAFAASVIGGFGSIPGAVVGALFLGLTEIFGAAYISAAYRDAFAFIILIIVLLLRPQGIFGERVGEKA